MSYNWKVQHIEKSIKYLINELLKSIIYFLLDGMKLSDSAILLINSEFASNDYDLLLFSISKIDTCLFLIKNFPFHPWSVQIVTASLPGSPNTSSKRRFIPRYSNYPILDHSTDMIVPFYLPFQNPFMMLSILQGLPTRFFTAILRTIFFSDISLSEEKET